MINYHDVVNCNGKEYIVIKCNPKKVKAIDLSTGKTWNIPYYMAHFVRKANGADLAKHVTITDAALALGQPVVFTSYPKEAGVVFVVIGMTAAGVKVAPMFDSNDKFYRNVQPSSLKALSSHEVIPLLIK